MTSPTQAVFDAVESGDVATVQKFLDKGGDVNGRREALCQTWNKTPVTAGPTLLMMAMRMGQDEVAMLLLKKNADYLLVDQFKKTAGMYALEFEHDTMQSLRKIIHDLDAKTVCHTDEWGHNMIMYAALAGATDIVDLLLEVDTVGDSLLARVQDGEHPSLDLLSLSTKHGKAFVIEHLLKQATRKATLLDNSRSNDAAGGRKRTAEPKKGKLNKSASHQSRLSCRTLARTMVSVLRCEHAPSQAQRLTVCTKCLMRTGATAASLQHSSSQQHPATG